MCGITGKVDYSDLHSDHLRESVSRMNDQIVHRGPDDDGVVIGRGAAIGMRRLSIIDVSGGHQPISNEAGDIHVVCNGEIYNFAELRSELLSRGHQFSTNSDAEVIVHLYEDFGEGVFERLRGMFGLAILDERSNRVLIARDRLGKKPLFVAQDAGKWWFASEMKSMLADEPSLAEVNHSILGHYFQFAYIPEPETIYSKIKRLPAGHFAVFEQGTYREQSYWDLDFETDHTCSEQEWIEQLDTKLAEAVQIRLQSEVPLGVFLSGGLDSSAVVAYAHKAGLDPLKTFTIGFDRPESDESEDAELIAKHFGTQHHLLRLEEQELSSSFESTLNAIIHHCDEPFGDASAIPTYHVSKLAREHVTVILSGDGGDELFAGYTSYRGALFAQKYRRALPYAIGRHGLPGVAGAVSRCMPLGVRSRVQRVEKVLRDSALPFLESYRDKTSIWNRDQLTALFSSQLLAESQYLGEQYMPDALWERVRRLDSHTNASEVINALTEVDMCSYMRDDILVKVDRMSMAHSLEVRSPLLDHELVELAARMPASMKIRGGVAGLGSQGKYALRKALEGKLPKRSLRKGKQGFSVPLRDWFRGRLREYLHDQLRSTEALPQDLFNSKAVEKTLEEHDRGTADHANRLWLLLTYATWKQQSSLQARTGPASSPRSLDSEEVSSCVS